MVDEKVIKDIFKEIEKKFPYLFTTTFNFISSLFIFLHYIINSKAIYRDLIIPT